jgi:hypothetical protein
MVISLRRIATSLCACALALSATGTSGEEKAPLGGSGEACI